MKANRTADVTSTMFMNRFIMPPRRRSTGGSNVSPVTKDCKSHFGSTFPGALPAKHLHGEVEVDRRGQDMDDQKNRPRYRSAAYDGYLSLPLAAAYLWRSRRGLRGRLSQIVYYRPDGRQILFKKADSGGCRETFRVDPIDPGEHAKEAAKARRMGKTGKKKPPK